VGLSSSFYNNLQPTLKGLFLRPKLHDAQQKWLNLLYHRLIPCVLHGISIPAYAITILGFAHNRHAGQAGWRSQSVAPQPGDAAASHRSIVFCYACLDGYTAINRSPELHSLVGRMYPGQERLAWSEMFYPLTSMEPRRGHSRHGWSTSSAHQGSLSSPRSLSELWKELCSGFLYGIESETKYLIRQ
jgi:hypothetical protein